jgi:hypothetical protein
VKPLKRIGFVAAAMMVTIAMVPSPAQAAPPVTLHVRGETNWEAAQSCPPPTATGPCAVVGGTLMFSIYWTSSKAPGQFNVGWELFGGTMTAGVDFTGPTSGIATIAANQGQTYVVVPLVSDGLAETNETVNLRVTSSSIPANFSTAVDVSTALDGAQIPADCAAARVSQYSMSISCSGRPPAQQWHTMIDCFNPWNPDSTDGPVVIGNGTSLADCGPLFKAYNPFFFVDVV